MSKAASTHMLKHRAQCYSDCLRHLAVAHDLKEKLCLASMAMQNRFGRVCRHWQHSEMWWPRLLRGHAAIQWDDYEKDYSDLPPQVYLLSDYYMLQAACMFTFLLLLLLWLLIYKMPKDWSQAPAKHKCATVLIGSSAD